MAKGRAPDEREAECAGTHASVGGGAENGADTEVDEREDDAATAKDGGLPCVKASESVEVVSGTEFAVVDPALDVDVADAVAVVVAPAECASGGDGDGDGDGNGSTNADCCSPSAGWGGRDFIVLEVAAMVEASVGGGCSGADA